MADLIPISVVRLLLAMQGSTLGSVAVLELAEAETGRLSLLVD